MRSRASVRNSIVDTGKNKGAGSYACARREKRGTRRRVPRLWIPHRSERQADAQAELPLVELGAIDFQEAPTGNIAIGDVEVW